MFDYLVATAPTAKPTGTKKIHTFFSKTPSTTSTSSTCSTGGDAGAEEVEEQDDDEEGFGDHEDDVPASMNDVMTEAPQTPSSSSLSTQRRFLTQEELRALREEGERAADVVFFCTLVIVQTPSPSPFPWLLLTHIHALS